MVTMQTRAANSSSPPTFSHLSVEPHYPMLQESIKHLLWQLEAGVSDFGHFNSVFSRIIQTVSSPPLEVIWFYAAVNFRTNKFAVANHANKYAVANHDELGKILALKELFHLLVSCSAPCSSLKRVAVLAPLIFELYSLVCGLKVQTGFSIDQTVSREIDCLIEGILSYVSICCCEGINEHDDSPALSPCFLDLIKVWTAGKCDRDSDFTHHVGAFFPTSSDEVRSGINVGCGVGFLAGVVMWESFVLNLCFKFGLAKPGKLLENDFRDLAVSTINGFRTCYFFDILLKMLLEPTLCVTSLLSSTDEVLLQEILFDAVITVEYSFFNAEVGLKLCDDHWKALALAWLFVVSSGLRFARQHGNNAKVISYTSSFCTSHIHSQLKRWFANQTGMVEVMAKSNICDPSVFVEWLLDLGRQASSRGSNNPDLLNLLQKALEYKVRVLRCECSLQNLNRRNKDSIIRCSFVNGGTQVDDEDLAMADPTSAACLSHGMVSGGGRKRKEGRMDEDIRAKITKYHDFDSSVRKFYPVHNDDGMAGRNEVESSVMHDEEMEIMVQ